MKTKRTAVIAKKPTFGWCDACRDRTGSRRFRELLNNLCVECRQLRLETATAYKSLVETESERQLERSRSRKSQPSQQRLSSSKQKKLLEEQQLGEALLKVPVGDCWISAIAAQLGWTREHTRTVGRRLRRKGVKPSSADLILQELAKAQKSLSVYQLSERVPFGTQRITEVLDRLVKIGVAGVVCSGSNFPNLYFAESTKK